MLLGSGGSNLAVTEDVVIYKGCSKPRRKLDLVRQKPQPCAKAQGLVIFKLFLGIF